MVENFLEDDNILSKLKDEEADCGVKSPQPSLQVLIRVYCGPLGNGVRMELPDCFLKVVQSLLKSKDRNKEYTGFKTVSKRSKSSCD